MGARKKMQERMFAELEEEGPLPRDVLAERGTLDGDLKRSARIIRDLIEEETLVVLPDGRIDLHPDQKGSALERMIQLNQQHSGDAEDQ